jgi:transcriptional regulator with XRE-family HTH domain
MSERTRNRKPGDPLSATLVRRLREQLRLTQEALAERMGLSSKAVVSGWETGRASCEGPSAELLLRLVGREASELSAELEALAESVWRRSGNWSDTWRQISAVPDVAVEMERDTFLGLFPDAALPSDQHVHGFPFVSYGLPPNVFGLGSTGWTGCIPVEQDRTPHYTWHLTREASFAYREIPWEISLNSIVTSGHTHIGSLLEITASTTFFLQRLAQKARFAPSLYYTLSLDLEGMRGRGIVGAIDRFEGMVDSPQTTSSENRVHASITSSIKDVSADPMRVAFSLVGEVALLLRPNLADTAALKKQLMARVRHDQQQSPRMRFLGFADAYLGR